MTVLVIAGCGGDSGGEGEDSPLGNALGYAAKDTPFVVSITTDVEGSQVKGLQAIGERFSFADQLVSSLEDSLSEGDLDYEKDLKPVLGNEFVVAATDVQSFTGDGDSSDFVGAIEAKDEKALDALIEKSEGKKSGEKDGATIYEDDDGGASAVEDGTLIVAGDRKLLDEALARHGGDDSLSSDDFEDGVADLPEDNLFRGYFDVAGLLEATEGSEQALKVKYLAAAEKFGFSAATEDDSLTIDFHLASDGEELTEEDLPLAAGPASPRVIEARGEIGLGLRDPQQVLAFAEAAGQAVGTPPGFGEYNSGKQTLERRLGEVSLEEESLLGQLEDDLSGPAWTRERQLRPAGVGEGPASASAHPRQARRRPARHRRGHRRRGGSATRSRRPGARTSTRCPRPMAERRRLRSRRRRVRAGQQGRPRRGSVSGTAQTSPCRSKALRAQSPSAADAQQLAARGDPPGIGSARRRGGGDRRVAVHRAPRAAARLGLGRRSPRRLAASSRLAFD